MNKSPEKQILEPEKEGLGKIAVDANGRIVRFSSYKELAEWAEEQNDPANQ